MVSIPIERNVLQWNGNQCVGSHGIPLDTSPSRRGAFPEWSQRGTGGFHYNPVSATNHPEVKTMPQCVACGAELEPPVHAPHTLYVKNPYVSRE